ncbi:MAG TPA: hypothetical protein VNA25_09685, partial [Phycisphaerae bacterium]|nr:hypothetical protein [Phycisphaerae bacterium]
LTKDQRTLALQLTDRVVAFGKQTRAQAKARSAERAAAFYKNVGTNIFLHGNFSYTTEDGRPLPVLDAINNHPDLSGPQQNALRSMVTAAIESANTPKEASEAEKYAAQVDIMETANSGTTDKEGRSPLEQALLKNAEYINVLGFTQSKANYKALTEDKVVDKYARVMKDVEETFDDMKTVATKPIDARLALLAKSRSDKAPAERETLRRERIAILTKFNKLKSNFYGWIGENSEATEPEVLEQQHLMMAPVLKEEAKKIVFSSGFETSVPGQFARMRTRRAGTAPAVDRTGVPNKVPDTDIKWFRALDLETQTYVRNNLAVMSWGEFKAEFTTK